MNRELTIGIPNNQWVHIRFALSLTALNVPDETGIISLERVMIDSARNMIAEKALNRSKYLLFIDSDMVFSPDFYYRLKQHDKDIVGGLAFKRKPPFEPCTYLQKEDGNFYSYLPNEFSEIDSIGTAGILIKTEVFENIDRPWFETGYDAEGTHWSVDFDFCKKAKEAGYKIWCDPETTMGHVGDNQIVTKEQFLKFNQDNEKF